MAAQKPIDAPEPRKVVRMRVWYEDGTSSAIFNPNKPELLVAFEAEFGDDSPQNTSQVMWLAWHALGRPGADYEAWRATVEDVERLEMDLGKAYR